MQHNTNQAPATRERKDFDKEKTPIGLADSSAPFRHSHTYRGSDTVRNTQVFMKQEIHHNLEKAELEVLAQELFRFITPSQPRYSLVISADATQNPIYYIVSEAVDGFTAITTEYDSTQHKHLGGILVTSLLLGETDLKAGNLGFRVKKQGNQVTEKSVAKIDGDQTFRYMIAPDDYHITSNAIALLPNIDPIFYKAFHWGDQVKKRIWQSQPALFNAALQNNPALRLEINIALYKILVLPDSVYKSFISQYITDTVCIDNIYSALMKQKKALLKAALQNEDFYNFIVNPTQDDLKKQADANTELQQFNIVGNTNFLARHPEVDLSLAAENLKNEATNFLNEQRQLVTSLKALLDKGQYKDLSDADKNNFDNSFFLLAPSFREKINIDAALLKEIFLHYIEDAHKNQEEIGFNAFEIEDRQVFCQAVSKILMGKNNIKPFILAASNPAFSRAFSKVCEPNLLHAIQTDDIDLFVYLLKHTENQHIQGVPLDTYLANNNLQKFQLLLSDYLVFKDFKNPDNIDNIDMSDLARLNETISRGYNWFNDPSPKEDYNTALHFAILEDNANLVNKILCANDGFEQVEVPNSLGETPLMLSLQCKNEMIRVDIVLAALHLYSRSLASAPTPLNISTSTFSEFSSPRALPAVRELVSKVIRCIENEEPLEERHRDMSLWIPKLKDLFSKLPQSCRDILIPPAVTLTESPQ